MAKAWVHIALAEGDAVRQSLEEPPKRPLRS
jgi:hypothetical protein